MEKVEFEVSCYLRLPFYEWNGKELTKLSDSLKKFGYSVSEDFNQEPSKKSDFIHIITNTDGNVTRIDCSEGIIDTPSDTVKCHNDIYIFLVLAQIQKDNTRNSFYTNGILWWHNRDDNPYFVGAAERNGFHRASIKEIMEQYQNYRSHGYYVCDIHGAFNEMNCRMHGRTTRLVDHYVQELFKHAGEWVSVSDHHPKGTEYLTQRLFNRMKNEHHIEIEISRTGGIHRVRISPQDINFLA